MYCSRTLWVSRTNSPVRLGVSPAAASTPIGVFSQWFEVLFPCAGALGCTVCLTPQLFLPGYLPVNVGPPTPQAAASLCLPSTALPLVLSTLVLVSTPLPVSTPPTCLDECFFFTSLVVRLPYNLIFCHFWLFFVFKLLLSFFGCMRRHSVSTYTSILASSLF